MAWPLIIGAAAAAIPGMIGKPKNRRTAKDFSSSDAYDPNAARFGDAGAMQYASGRQSQAQGIDSRGAPQTDYGQANYARDQGRAAREAQAGAANMMMRRAAGQTPSIAGMQAKRDMQQANAAQASAAASARGPAALALAQQGAANNMANQQSSISNQAQINAANERMQAEQAAFGAQSGIRGQDLGAQGQEAQMAQYMSSMELQNRSANDARAMGYEQMGHQAIGAEQQGRVTQQGQLAQSQAAAEAANQHTADQNASSGGVFETIGDFFSDRRAKTILSDFSSKDSFDINAYTQKPEEEKEGGGDGGMMSMIGGMMGGGKGGGGGMMSDERAKQQAYEMGRTEGFGAAVDFKKRGMKPSEHRYSPEELQAPFDAKKTEQRLREYYATHREKFQNVNGKETWKSPQEKKEHEERVIQSRLAGERLVHKMGGDPDLADASVLEAKEAAARKKKQGLADRIAASKADIASGKNPSWMSPDTVKALEEERAYREQQAQEAAQAPAAAPPQAVAAAEPSWMDRALMSAKGALSFSSDFRSKQPFQPDPNAIDLDEPEAIDLDDQPGPGQMQFDPSRGWHNPAGQSAKDRVMGAMDDDDRIEAQQNAQMKALPSRRANDPAVGLERVAEMRRARELSGEGPKASPMFAQEEPKADDGKTMAPGTADFMATEPKPKGEDDPPWWASKEDERDGWGNQLATGLKIGNDFSRAQFASDFSSKDAIDLDEPSYDRGVEDRAGKEADELLASFKRRSGEESAVSKQAVATRMKPSDSPVAKANRTMKGEPYVYKPQFTPPDQKPGEPNFGFMAQNLEKHPITKTAVKEDSTGMKRVDALKLLRVLGASVADLQEQEDQTRLMLAKGGRRK
jgi:hypothetical protein